MKIRVLAILAGLAVDFIGSVLFAITVILILGIFRRGWDLLSGIPTTELLLAYWIGLGFTLFGAYVTARLSAPNCVLNTLLFGLLSTIPSFFFVSGYPLWFTVLCVITILPVSVAAGYAVAARTV